MCIAASTVVATKVNLIKLESGLLWRGKVYIPDECSEDDGGDTAAPEGTMANPPLVTPQRSNSNESCEPEDHGDELDTGDGILVGRGGETGRGEHQVGDGQQSPDGSKQHEGDAARYPCDVGIDDYDMVSSRSGTTGLISRTVCSQTKDDDAEEHLGTTKAHDNGWSDHVGGIKKAMSGWLPAVEDYVCG